MEHMIDRKKITIYLFAKQSNVQLAYLNEMAMINVKEETVLTMEATTVGDVYLKLTKYAFRVKLTL